LCFHLTDHGQEVFATVQGLVEAGEDEKFLFTVKDEMLDELVKENEFSGRCNQMIRL
jgi:hypothetical protein